MCAFVISKKAFENNAHLVIRRRSKKLGEPRRRGIDGDRDELLLFKLKISKTNEENGDSTELISAFQLT